MKTMRIYAAVGLGMAGLMLTGSGAWAELTGQGEKLQARYEQMLAKLQAEVAPVLPQIDAQQQAAFVEAESALQALPAPELGSTAADMATYKEVKQQAEDAVDQAARAILTGMDAFLSSSEHDAAFSKIALLKHATPRGLAMFAQQSPENEALIETLLADDALVQQIMRLGGCYRGRYGDGMASYTAILKASEHARDGFLRRFALASAMEHPQVDKETMVNVYLDYEKAWFAGILDPTFDSHSDFNYRFVMFHFGVENLNWMRDMLRTYRPDHVRNPDFRWRYCGIVKTDVPYRTGLTGKRPLRPDLNLTQYQDFFLKGGICGPRAFSGQLATSAFGIPTRKAAQTGHAAMSRWTPDGWSVVFGSGNWAANHHRNINGADFSLEERARRAPGDEYNKVHRLHWVGDTLQDTPTTIREDYDHNRGKHLWNSLANMKKYIIIADARITAAAVTGEELAESNESSEEDEVAEAMIREEDKQILYGDDGVITILPGACVKPTNSTRKIIFMRTIEDDGVQVHYGIAGKQPEVLTYYVEAPAAGKYALTMQVGTVTVDRIFMLRLNRRTLLDIPLPYTKGYWQDTEPVTVELREGRNTLMFTGPQGNRGVSIKQFKLRPI